MNKLLQRKVKRELKLQVITLLYTCPEAPDLGGDGQDSGVPGNLSYIV